MSGRTESAQREGDLLDTAVEYFSRSFPNPRREGCPHPDRIRGLASLPEPVAGEVRTHLFQCSECFREFRRERSAVASAAATAAPREMPRILRGSVRPLAGVAASMALAAGLGLTLWLGFERTASQKPAGSGTRPASSAATVLTSLGPAPEFPAVVAIQLQPSSVRRGPSASLESSVPAVVVRPRPIRFEIALPEGYPDGIYLVAIVDPFDEPLGEVSAAAVGRSLVTLIDLTDFESGRRFLRIQQTARPPDYVPIVVERPPSR